MLSGRGREEIGGWLQGRRDNPGVRLKAEGGDRGNAELGASIFNLILFYNLQD